MFCKSRKILFDFSPVQQKHGESTPPEHVCSCICTYIHTYSDVLLYWVNKKVVLVLLVEVEMEEIGRGEKVGCCRIYEDVGKPQIISHLRNSDPDDLLAEKVKAMEMLR